MTMAEDALRAVVKRRTARKVLFKSSDAYERLYGELQRAMTHAWDERMREGITAALDRLRDMGSGTFTKEDATAILRSLEGSVGAEAIRAAMHDPVVNLSDALFRVGADEVGTAAGVEVAFMRPDLDALDILKSGNLYWVGNSWDSHTRDVLDRHLREYFETGMTRDELTRRFADDLSHLAERSQRYWELLADHTASKTREMGRVTGYERVGATEVQVRAHLDERTTTICRHMHGRIIKVSRLREQRDAYLDAVSRQDGMAAKAAWTMHGQEAGIGDTPTRKLDRATASPPYHFQCRTITVMYLRGQETPIDRWSRAAHDRETVSRTDVEAIIERAKIAEWPHTKVARGHYRKHQLALGVADQATYSQSAIDLIRRGDRDVYLSVRKGVLNATFVRKAARVTDGEPGFVITAVDLQDNKITSHHWRPRLATSGDEVPAKKQPGGRGIAKWILG